MFNPDQGNLQGKVGFVFETTTFIGFAGTFFFLPETKNRTALEFHELFECRVPTWDFKKYMSDDEGEIDSPRKQ
jgi:MFS transporter, SP family, general alpha glucoside:H+ symporter